MQFLTVLLLIIGVAVVMAAAFAVISFGFGVHLYGREGNRADPADKDPCAQCNADRDWYTSLPLWKQTAMTAWWWANRFQCVAKGCR